MYRGLLDILRDVLSSVAARPSRSALASAGVAAAVFTTILVVGVASMGRADVAEAFQAQVGDRVRVDIIADGSTRTISTSDLQTGFPAPGVLHVAALGRLYDLTLSAHPTFDAGAFGIGVYGAWSSGSVEQSLGIEIVEGRSFDIGHNQRAERIALVGSEAARQLGLPPPDGRSTIVIENRVYVVAGVFEDTAGLALSDSILLPAATAERDLGLDGFSSIVAVAQPPETAAHLAERLPFRILPTHPGALRVTFQAGDPQLATVVLAQLLRLTWISLAVGAATGGIVMAALMTTVVVERRSEIGLRRALGAPTNKVVIQFMAEGAYIGMIGAATGLIAGTAVLLPLAEFRGQPVALPSVLPWLVLVQGPVVGLLASIWPATRAARQDPVSALSSP